MYISNILNTVNGALSKHFNIYLKIYSIRAFEFLIVNEHMLGSVIIIYNSS
jgi:hypothetical protein